ncbi:hypothetical protein Q4511_07150 [Paracoccus sp. 1_MG-2023]|uniref:hypothetical protein n=1 Tax=unclassified Paracoccus (in: a-proteobacteria) TaxID=2688777 RepID=UPI001C0968D3|nr:MULTISPECIES: hypothetical protein [unclassified Paracoccus (in: a-proteobacteria)]MBU2956590.1 hypothetical protein [Paracoccus sp. C2R09]MDO6668696.1 hypothetical protein [Paracoccus sp. 1_MG-2023]
MTMYDWLIWIGAALTVTGLAGIVWCIATVARARKAGLDDEGLRLRMRKVLAVNMGALAFSTIGLMMVVVGVMLAP